MLFGNCISDREGAWLFLFFLSSILLDAVSVSILLLLLLLLTFRDYHFSLLFFFLLSSRASIPPKSSFARLFPLLLTLLYITFTPNLFVFF
jgi:hypothetical protein